MIWLKRFTFIGLFTILIGCVPTTELAPTLSPSSMPPTAYPQPTQEVTIEDNGTVESDMIQAPAAATADRSERLTPGAVPGSVEAVGEMGGGETAVTPAIIEPIPDALFNQLIENLATQTGEAAPSYKILRAEAVIWNDGSLGCAQPGMFYTQALVDGYWVILQVGEKTFDYRLSQNGQIVHCERNLRNP